MDSGIIDCLVMILFSAVICIGLPRVSTSIASNFTSKIRFSSNSVKPLASDSPQSTGYPELTTASN